jgi:hypothetical protein
MLEMGRLPLQN